MGVVMQLNRLSCPFPWHYDAFSDPIYCLLRLSMFVSTIFTPHSTELKVRLFGSPHLITLRCVDREQDDVAIICPQTKMLEGRTNLSECVSPWKHFSTTRIPNTVLTPLKNASPEKRIPKGLFGLPTSSFGRVML